MNSLENKWDIIIQEKELYEKEKQRIKHQEQGTCDVNYFTSVKASIFDIPFWSADLYHHIFPMIALTCKNNRYTSYANVVIKMLVNKIVFRGYSIEKAFIYVEDYFNIRIKRDFYCSPIVLENWKKGLLGNGDRLSEKDYLLWKKVKVSENLP